jgi:hypothetical protein
MLLPQYTTAPPAVGQGRVSARYTHIIPIVNTHQRAVNGDTGVGGPRSFGVDRSCVRSVVGSTGTACCAIGGAAGAHRHRARRRAATHRQPGRPARSRDRRREPQRAARAQGTARQDPPRPGGRAPSWRRGSRSSSPRPTPPGA